MHLDSGALLGQEVIVEGVVVNVGKYTTHLVLSDESARMLVVLTNVIDAEGVVASERKNLRILGTVERGKMGLPFIMAEAVVAADAQPKKT